MFFYSRFLFLHTFTYFLIFTQAIRHEDSIASMFCLVIDEKEKETYLGWENDFPVLQKVSTSELRFTYDTFLLGVATDC